MTLLLLAYNEIIVGSAMRSDAIRCDPFGWMSEKSQDRAALFKFLAVPFAQGNKVSRFFNVMAPDCRRGQTAFGSVMELTVACS